MLFRGVLAGLISGTALGLFLKGIEAMTGQKVYVLLLNVDFIYSSPFPEIIEFNMHLAVSSFIGILYVYILYFFRIQFKAIKGLSAMALTVPAIFLYFPLTSLAEKETPAFNDYPSIGWWTAGHILFAAVLACSEHFINKKTPQ
ncbi:hypothetical protein [Metabacillus idriensis]|uniref:hypothetical protein n=1 Tax=Metabacillus idriensis TaxID=324768 RepID=UPI00174C3FFE|nr:hypothetical protein [Metabacillus idriensis]